MYVFVLDKRKEPLTPCRPSRARHLLDSGRAVVHKLFPFTIRLKDWSERPPLDEVMGTLQRQLLALPEATIMTFAPPTLPGMPAANSRPVSE